MRRWAGRAAAVLGVLAPALAWGQTPSPLQPVPNGINISVLRPTAVNVKWVVTGATPGARGTSTAGHFVTGSITAATTATTPAAAIAANCTGATTTFVRPIDRLDSTVTMLVGPNGVGRAVETLIVSGLTAQRALQGNQNATFSYCRVFAGTGTATPSANFVTCRPGSSAYADFSIGRVELFFENRRREITVPLNTQNLRVHADIAYNGSGILRAVWEVAEASASGTLAGANQTGSVSAPPTVFANPNDPNLTALARGFRTLQVVNQYVGFGDRVLLTLPGTPSLPTNAPGAYDVNLRIVEPPVPFAIPLARYFVAAGGPVPRSTTIALRTPADGAVLAPGALEFRWEPITNIAHYRLDIYPRETVALPQVPAIVGGPATSAVGDSNVFNRGPRDLGIAPGPLSALIPSQVSSFSLRPSQVTRLTPGASYAWRIRALDPQGNIVAESPLGQFTIQPK
jgi:hypothetical protein